MLAIKAIIIAIMHALPTPRAFFTFFCIIAFNPAPTQGGALSAVFISGFPVFAENDGRISASPSQIITPSLTE